jgi:resuscitation-promoting factor RpfA
LVTRGTGVTIWTFRLTHPVAQEGASVRIDLKAKSLSAVTAGVGVIAGLMVAAPPALAEPLIPIPPPPPPPPAVAAPPALAEPLIPIPPPPPPQDAPVQPVAAEPALPPEDVPHLSSPENLPPGTSDEPVGPPQGRGLSYLRELWHAVQTQEVSGGDALLLLTQRPMNPTAAPPPGVPAGPQPPLLPAPPPPLPPAPPPLLPLAPPPPPPAP